MNSISFTLKEEINGPFNFKETFKSGQTAEPEWFSDGKGFWKGIKLYDTYLKTRMKAKGTIDKPEFQVDVIAPFKVDLKPSIKDQIQKKLVNLFNLDYDLDAFYSKFKDEAIANTFPYMKGLRLMRGLCLFETLICSILSQNSSIIKWNKSFKRIAEFFSNPVEFIDGSLYHPFPDPGYIASADIQNLHICKVGYRSRYIAEASFKVDSGELNLSKLKSLPFKEARALLMKLRGVGSKVADCFLLYGLGFEEASPIDTWIQAIAPKIYPEAEGMSIEELGGFFRRRYGSYAGLVQLYLYHYSRKFWKQKTETAPS